VLGAGPTARAECMQAQSALKLEARGSEKQLARGGRRLMMALQKVGGVCVWGGTVTAGGGPGVQRALASGVPTSPPPLPPSPRRARTATSWRCHCWCWWRSSWTTPRSRPSASTLRWGVFWGGGGDGRRGVRRAGGRRATWAVPEGGKPLCADWHPASPPPPPQLIADLSDDVMTTVLTYLEFLRSNMRPEDYCDLLPPIKVGDVRGGGGAACFWSRRGRPARRAPARKSLLPSWRQRGHARAAPTSLPLISLHSPEPKGAA
jgi:hypothetical protein